MVTNYGQAAILTLSNRFFARDGIAAEGTINQEQIIAADVGFGLLNEQRVKGSIIPLQDLIKEAHDSVVHFSDYKVQQLVVTENAQESSMKLAGAAKKCPWQVRGLCDANGRTDASVNSNRLVMDRSALEFSCNYKHE
jgi:hypothetical protein